MVIGSVVQDHDGLARCGSTGAVELAQEVEKRLRPKPLGLAAVDEAPVTETDGAKVAHTLAGGVVEQNRVSGFGRHPEAAARSMLLEMNFVQRPKINGGVADEPTEFFLPSPVGRGRHGR